MACETVVTLSGIVSDSRLIQSAKQLPPSVVIPYSSVIDVNESQ